MMREKLRRARNALLALGRSPAQSSLGRPGKSNLLDVPEYVDIQAVSGSANSMVNCSLSSVVRAWTI